MTRKQALAAGLRFYSGGNQRCPLGHTPVIRYAITGKCVACTKTEGVRYKAQRKVHAARTSAANVARVRAWRKRKPAHTLKLAATYRARHRQEICKRNVTYRATHPTDPLDRVIREARRRARKADAGGSHTKADIAAIFRQQRGKCAYFAHCRTPLAAGFHVDHIMPICRGGSDGADNLQLTCPACNYVKGRRHPAEFARWLAAR